MSGADTIPPRDGEGDRAKRGEGGFAVRPGTVSLARRERRSGNLPEVAMWRILRMRPGGFKFRQHPIDSCSLDFACLAARLAIEIDGEAHNRGDRPTRGEDRDARLAAFGFASLRLPACEVLENVDAVSGAVFNACAQRMPLHQPSAGPPPRAGEVLP